MNLQRLKLAADMLIFGWFLAFRGIFDFLVLLILAPVAAVCVLISSWPVSQLVARSYLGAFAQVRGRLRP